MTTTTLYRPPSRTFTGFANEARMLCARLTEGTLDRVTFLEQCARMANTAVGCSRTGIWMFVETDRGRVLRCLAMYDAVSDAMKRVADETHEVLPYFRALEQDGFVNASDAQGHPATHGLLGRRLGASGIHSLLASSFAVNGHLFGAFTCTQVGARKDWTPRQLASLRQIGGAASLALFRSSRFTVDTGFGPLVT